MPFRYLGNFTRTYTQYRDTAADMTLVADPGGTYDMAPAGGVAMPVPPADGLWQAADPPSLPSFAAPAAVTVTPPAPTAPAEEN